MTTKTFKIDYFQASVGADGKGGKVSDLFERLCKPVTENPYAPEIEDGGFHYQITHIQHHSGISAYRGLFVKLRSSNIPHIGDTKGNEREIELNQEEGVLEKNHFVFYDKHQLLVYQVNSHASHPNRLAKYLTDLIGVSVSLDPVLQPEPMKRFMRGDVQPKKLSMRIARPTNSNIFPSDSWNDNVLSILDGAGGAKMNVEIMAPPTRKVKKFLNQGIKDNIKDLMNRVDVKAARLVVVDDGVEHPIDLIADRIKDTVSVEMLGSYPAPRRMFEAMEESKRVHDHLFEQIFSDNDDAID